MNFLTRTDKIAQNLPENLGTTRHVLINPRAYWVKEKQIDGFPSLALYPVTSKRWTVEKIALINDIVQRTLDTNINGKFATVFIGSK